MCYHQIDSLWIEATYTINALKKVSSKTLKSIHENEMDFT